MRFGPGQRILAIEGSGSVEGGCLAGEFYARLDTEVVVDVLADFVPAWRLPRGGRR